MNHSVHKTGLNDFVHKSDWICSQFQLTDLIMQSQQCLISVRIIYLSQHFQKMCLNDLKILSEWSVHKLDWIGSQFLLTDSMIHSQWAAGIWSVNKINCIALFVTQSSCMTEDGRLLWCIYKLFETWKLRSTFMHGKSNQHLLTTF